MGLPYFAPAYILGNEIHIHGCHRYIDFLSGADVLIFDAMYSMACDGLEIEI